MVDSRIAILADIADEGVRFRCAGHFLLRSTRRMLFWGLVAHLKGVTGGCLAGRGGTHGECQLSICCTDE